MFLMVNVFLSCRGGVCPPEYINVCICGCIRAGKPCPYRLIAAIPCPRCGEAFAACNSVPTLWGSFRSLQFRAHAVRKLSQLAIPCPRCGEAFAACDSVPTLWGSFRSLQFRAHVVGKLSQPAIPCPRCGEAFAACDSVPTPWGSFRSYLSWSATCHGALKRLNDA